MTFWKDTRGCVGLMILAMGPMAIIGPEHAFAQLNFFNSKKKPPAAKPPPKTTTPPPQTPANQGSSGDQSAQDNEEPKPKTRKYILRTEPEEEEEKPQNPMEVVMFHKYWEEEFKYVRFGLLGGTYKDTHENKTLFSKGERESELYGGFIDWGTSVFGNQRIGLHGRYLNPESEDWEFNLVGQVTWSYILPWLKIIELTTGFDSEKNLQIIKNGEDQPLVILNFSQNYIAGLGFRQLLYNGDPTKVHLTAHYYALSPGEDQNTGSEWSVLIETMRVKHKIDVNRRAGRYSEIVSEAERRLSLGVGAIGRKYTGSQKFETGEEYLINYETIEGFLSVAFWWI